MTTNFDAPASTNSVMGQRGPHSDSGREGDHLLAGFSPRTANLVIYVMPGYGDPADQLASLGKHKLGKSCLYINKLADVNLDVLEQIVADGVTEMCQAYQTWDD